MFGFALLHVSIVSLYANKPNPLRLANMEKQTGIGKSALYYETGNMTSFMPDAYQYLSTPNTALQFLTFGPVQFLS